MNQHYLKIFGVATLLGGIGEIIKSIGGTMDFLILGGFFSTITLSITILIIILTRKHLRDITWQIIEFQMEELKEMDELKNQLMDFASHEIRTPLSIVWGNIELLHRDEGHGNLTKEQRQKIFNAIERNYQSIEKMINKSFDISRLRRDLFELEEELVDLSEIIANTIKNMKKYVEKNDLQITFRKEDDDSFDKVSIDPDRIDQVLRNLIENSVKFSDSGEIVVRLRDTSHEYVISVKDEGRGVDPDDFNNIFELYKNKKVTKIQGQGLGLGLYISRSIVELHDGKIWVESEGEGKGSTFSFSIPKNIGI